MNSEVFVVKTESKYPVFPYTAADNVVEKALLELFRLWGRDPLNPLDGWVPPGGRVLIKPNWVLSSNPLGYDLDSLVSHSSVLIALAERAAHALRGGGRIVIADAPLQGCNFERLMQKTRMFESVDTLRQRYPGIEFIIEDWRLTLMNQSKAEQARWGAIGQERRRDYETVKETNYQIVNLERGSFLEDISEFSDRFRVTQYKPSLMIRHHRPGTHEYLVTKRVFESDLIINVPKLKTHIKAGLTGALKNLVGINGHKEYLPHHIRGSYAEGGDCYDRPSALRRIYDNLYDDYWENYASLPSYRRQMMRIVLGVLWRASTVLTMDGTNAGSWSRNETIWRTTLDLNQILYFSPNSAPKIISIMDGIVAGHGEGPLTPTPYPAGLLLGGENPAYVDAVVAQFMGYNISRIPTVYHALYHRKSRFAGVALEDFQVAVKWEAEGERRVPIRDLPILDFIKPRYWRHAQNPTHLAIQSSGLSEVVSVLNRLGASDHIEG